jgi:leucyl-tRNA synthetase
MDKYEPQTIEEKWQRVWADAHAFEVQNPTSSRDTGAPKSYVLEQLPYPSGTLHMGHMLVYTIGDVVTRFRSRNGMQVLHPQGFDSFGLPAENAAIKEGGHPRETVERNIAHIKRSMRRVGWAYDWQRELSTHDPSYYRWQQWQFLKFYERGLAYRKGAPVKWCPVDQTVLANEQVHDGRCERCGAEVESRLLEQWFFRITDYAQALLDDLETVDWPESIKARQRNWIGRSEGAEILFRIEELDEDVAVFTTRPDTLYGATFFVLAPEHELVARIDSDEVADYVRRAGAKKTAERAAAIEKTGVFTGLHAVNPVNGERLPVFVADYVLTDYGTGAIMAVPAHDQRDFDFATAFMPISRSYVHKRQWTSTAYVGTQAVLVSSAEFDACRRSRAAGVSSSSRRAWALHDQLPPARLGHLAPALLGLPDPGRLLRHVRDRAGAGRGAAGRAAGDRGLQAEGRSSAGPGRGVGERDVPGVLRAGEARDRDDGHVRRLVLVLPALLRRAQRHGTVRSRTG